MNIRMAKKWPEKVIQRSFIKEHSFVNRLYMHSMGFFIFAAVLKSRGPMTTEAAKIKRNEKLRPDTALQD